MYTVSRVLFGTSIPTADFPGPMDSGFQLLTRLTTTKEAKELVKSQFNFHILNRNANRIEFVFIERTVTSIVLVPFVPAMSPMEPEHSPFQGEREKCFFVSKNQF